MQESSSFLDKELAVDSASKITGPKITSIASIREKVICFSLVGSNVECIDCLDIFGDCAVVDIYVKFILILLNVMYQPVHVHEVQLRIHILEVTPHCVHYYVLFIMACHLFEVIHELLCFLF